MPVTIPENECICLILSHAFVLMIAVFGQHCTILILNLLVDSVVCPLKKII